LHASGGCDADAAEHGRERHTVVLQRLGRFLERGETGVAIESPIRVVAFDPLALLYISRVERTVHNERTADRGIAVQADSVEVDDEGIARQSAVDKERTGERVAARGAADAFGVGAARVDRPGLHRIAGVDVEGGLNGAGEEVMELRGLEGMG